MCGLCAHRPPAAWISSSMGWRPRKTSPKCSFRRCRSKGLWKRQKRLRRLRGVFEEQVKYYHLWPTTFAALTNNLSRAWKQNLLPNKLALMGPSLRPHCPPPGYPPKPGTIQSCTHLGPGKFLSTLLTCLRFQRVGCFYSRLWVEVGPLQVFLHWKRIHPGTYIEDLL